MSQKYFVYNFVSKYLLEVCFKSEIYRRRNFLQRLDSDAVFTVNKSLRCH